MQGGSVDVEAPKMRQTLVATKAEPIQAGCDMKGLWSHARHKIEYSESSYTAASSLRHES